MHPALTKLMKQTLKKFDIGITGYRHLQELEEGDKLSNLKARNIIELFSGLPDEHSAQLLKILRHSTSQIGQDVFALSETGLKTQGYFVEFGATNGNYLSNSFLLEKEFQWSGIVAEPAARWHQDLRKNRSCNIETMCVWKESGKVLTFNESDDGELSTIDSYSSSDLHRDTRKHGTKYDVETISLVDLLAKHEAPKIIDYLSIDTEGSEYEILSDFDFNQYQFRVITCEHNHEPIRDRIHKLLTKQGYIRKLEELSLFDDWYVKP